MDVGNSEEMGEHTEPEFECHREALRPKSFLHDEMSEFNKIFAELAKPKGYLSVKNCQSVEEAASTDEDTSPAELCAGCASKLSNSKTCCCCSTVEYEHGSSYRQATECMATISSQNKCRSTKFNHDSSHEASEVCFSFAA